MIRSPDDLLFTVSFLSPSAVPAASSGSIPRSNPFPESDYSDPPAEPVQTTNTMSADRALHSGRWHTWSRRRSGPWHWIWPKPPLNFSLPGHSFLARPARRDRPRPCGRPRPLRQLRRVRAISKPWPRSGGARVSPESPPLLQPLPLPLGPRVFGERRKRRSRAPSDLPAHPCLKLPRTEPLSVTSPQPVLEPHPWLPVWPIPARLESHPHSEPRLPASGPAPRRDNLCTSTNLLRPTRQAAPPAAGFAIRRSSVARARKKNPSPRKHFPPASPCQADSGWAGPHLVDWFQGDSSPASRARRSGAPVCLRAWSRFPRREAAAGPARVRRPVAELRAKRRTFRKNGTWLHCPHRTSGRSRWFSGCLFLQFNSCQQCHSARLFILECRRPVSVHAENL